MAIVMRIIEFACKSFHYFFTFLSVCLVISTYGNFQVFVSKQTLSIWEPDESVFLRCLWDFFLICLFMIQHSLMAMKGSSRIAAWLKVHGLERLVYNIFTCFSLLMLIFKWHSIPEAYLWYVDTQSRTLLWSFFLLCHIVAWFILGMELVLMDIKELVGISQVSAYYSGLPSPISSKARQLREIYSRMRHPGLTMLTFMLWFHPLMTLDRVLLASVFTTYMIGRHSFDDSHYTYAEKHMTTQWVEKQSKSSVRYEYTQAQD